MITYFEVNSSVYSETSSHFRQVEFQISHNIREHPLLMTSDGFWPFFTYLLTYLVLPYNVRFWGLSWTRLPTLISDVINGRSQIEIPFHFDRLKNELNTCLDKVVGFLVRHIGCGWASKSCLSLKLHQFSVLCNKRLRNNRIMTFCSIFHPCLQPSLGKKTKGQSSFWLDTDEPAGVFSFFHFEHTTIYALLST